MDATGTAEDRPASSDATEQPTRSKTGGRETPAARYLLHAGRRVRAVPRRWPIPTAWLLVVIVTAGMAWRTARPGDAACPVSDVAATTSAAAQGSDDPTTSDTDTEAGDLLPVLVPASDQPTVIALGRSREIREAHARFDVAAPSVVGTLTSDAGRPDTSGPQDNQGAGRNGGGEGTADDSDKTASAGEVPMAATDLTMIAGDDVANVSLATVVNPFIREDGTPLTDSITEDGEEQVLITAQADSRRGVVFVALCVDRSSSSVGHAGTYTGSVSIVDPRVARTDVPFVVQLAYPNPYNVALLVLVAVAAATAYAWLLRARTGQDEDISVENFRHFLTRRTGVLAFSSGSVAAYVAFAATYLQNGTWGTTVAQVTAIIGAVFSAFVTAAATILAGSGHEDSAPPAGGSDERTPPAERDTSDDDGSQPDGGDAAGGGSDEAKTEFAVGA